MKSMPDKVQGPKFRGVNLQNWRGNGQALCAHNVALMVLSTGPVCFGLVNGGYFIFSGLRLALLFYCCPFCRFGLLFDEI